MPEGDTLHRTAARLRPALAGAEVRRVEAPRLSGRLPAVGSRVDAVDAVGKHLVMRFSDGLTLETHLRMSGSWHLYRTGERWRKPAHLVRALVEVDEWVAVCFSAPVVRTYPTPPADDGAAPLGHLGPDLCLPDPDLDVAVSNLARFADADTEIHESLLDQRVAAGIGNVYKSEVLWACGIDPFTRTADVAPESRRRLLEVAARLLRANLTTVSRTTVPGGLAVYGRARQPCRRCGTPIRTARRGVQARSTYWCPTCQPPATTR
ncbi:MAG TPA: DNA-formamidopyrimidine glycosylase family protein [Acidimicrobiales bacterium]|nr:DNA-formamidopyrimidine glycosylase family protein [Acidimicrobiales bacterium]